MKFLVTGLGSIGQRHLKNLYQLSAGEIFAYRTMGEPIDLKGNYSFKTFYNFSKALDENPDAVLVTSPTSFHIPTALEAAKHGCHLFIEKPLSHNLIGVDELLEIASDKGLVVLVGYMLRFHPGLQLVKKFLVEKRIGRVLSARIEFGEYLPGWHPGEDYREGYSARKSLGGGPILTLSHELDYAYWLFGKAKEVFCLSDHVSELEIDTEDLAEIIIRFENNVIAQIHVDYLQRPPSRNCHIIGEEGAIQWDYYKKEVGLFNVEKDSWEIFKQNDFKRNQMFIDEMKHFINCIKGSEKPLISGMEGKEVLKIALAAIKSAETRTFEEV